MSIGVPEFWWPLDLSVEGEEQFLLHKNYLKDHPSHLNINAFNQTNSLIGSMMKSNIQEILDRDSIPNLCHVINGWGNSIYNGKELVQELSPFVFLKNGKNPFIEQCTPEGDFHPWQSFAYAAMGGIAGETLIGERKYQFADIMKNSVQINHFEGEELGHLLFAFAFYFKGEKDDQFLFKFDNGEFNAEQLLNWAIENHFSGEFRVCRKFHLTEGICAMASLNPNFKSYRLVAQSFLEGQLDLIIPIAKILDEAMIAIENKTPIAETSIIHEWREELVILDYLENHVYYAGHIIELASLAILMGYEISPSQRSGIISSMNSLNQIIPLYAPKMSFVDCFLGFGHYRRAITLFRAIEETKNKTDWDLLKHYTLNFDQVTPVDFSSSEVEIAKELLTISIFKVVDPLAQINPKLLEIITIYDQHSYSKKHALKGKFAHFRRLCPSGWPKSIHYELLDFGPEHQVVGIELHLESEEVKYVNNHFADLQTLLKTEMPGLTFKIDPSWYNGSGRISATIPYSKSAEFIVEAFIQLVETTRDKLNVILKEEYIKIE